MDFNLSASESSDENKKINNQISTTVKYDLLWQNYPSWGESNSQQDYDSSFDLSSSSSISTTISEDELSTVSLISNNLFKSNELKSISPTENYSFNRQKCTDLSLSEKRPYNTKMYPVRPCYPPIQDISISFGNEMNKQFLEKLQPDPQIRYAFYNRGFEMTASRHRKSSFTQFGMMPNIDECGSQENEDSNSGNDEWQNLRPSSPYYSGSSGRDITLLPKLKIRICDEMDRPVKDPFDESSSSDEYSCNDETAECCHPTDNLNSFDVKYQNNNVNTFLKCKKCGHHLRFQKQFSNAFA